MRRDSIRACLLAASCVVWGGPSVGLAYNIVAATNAANGAACASSRPFYWEIGGPSGTPVVSGQVGGTNYDRNTVLVLASASKWIFGAYVIQRYRGPPTGTAGQYIVDSLNMQRGYTAMFDPLCLATSTVAECFHAGPNPVQSPPAVGHFFYNSGQTQALAANPDALDLGAKTTLTLLQEVNRYLGLGSSFAYTIPAPSSGLSATPADYAAFLQNIMTGRYALSNYLNYSPVATYPCAAGLLNCSPLGSVNFHFSLNHWIEDNSGGSFPMTGTALTAGDGAYSSPGAFGFYPWISADKQYYGIVATQQSVGKYEATIPCGRVIRTAFRGP